MIIFNYDPILGQLYLYTEIQMLIDREKGDTNLAKPKYIKRKK